MSSKAEIRSLAVQVCQAVVELTRRQRDHGEQWVMLKSGTSQGNGET